MTTITWDTEPDFSILDVVMYLYPNIKCTVHSNCTLIYDIEETNQPTKETIESTAATSAYTNYNACKYCTAFIENCTYGTLLTQKECYIEQVNLLEETYNNGWVYFVKDEITYKCSLTIAEENLSKVVYLVNRAYADEWDELVDRFKCYTEDDTPVLLEATKQEAKKFAKNISKFQSNNTKHKEDLIDSINDAETLEELHLIDINSGWESTTIDIA